MGCTYAFGTQTLCADLFVPSRWANTNDVCFGAPRLAQMHALRASCLGGCAGTGGDPYWADPQGGVDGWAAPPEAPVPRLTCLLPTYMSSVGRLRRENNAKSSYNMDL